MSNAFAGLQTDTTGGSHIRFLVVNDSGMTSSITGSATINDGTWHHIVGVRDGSTFKLYVDGKLDASGTKTPGTVSLNTSSIGARKRSGVTGYFTGSIDEVALYPSALTANQINAHYQTGTTQPAYSATTAASSPTGYWRLGESSGTSAADASGGGHPGTYTGTPTLGVSGALAGDGNTGVTFNGSTQYVAGGDLSVEEGSTFTIEAWAKTTASTTGMMIAGEGNTAAMSNAFAGLQTDATSGSHVRFLVVDDSGTTSSITGSATINDGAWHHIVGVRNGSSFKVYIDGKLDTSGTRTPGTVTLNTSSIGARKRNGVTGYFAGSVDEVALYTSVLTANQINAHYQTGANLPAVVATYNYNGEGLRSNKTVAGIATLFSWSTATDLPQMLSDGTTSYIYGPSGTPLEQVTGTSFAYYYSDQQGTTRALTNGAGDLIGSFSTDPYGNASGTTGLGATPLRFNGQYADSESGFVYLRARYYDPNTGAFLAVDPLTVEYSIYFFFVV
jgi:RHS repeat-associated protein